MNIFVQYLFFLVLLDIYKKLLDAGPEPSNTGLSSKMLDGWQHCISMVDGDAEGDGG